MTDLAPKTQEQVPLLLASKLATPAGLQATNTLLIRRSIVLILNVSTWLALVMWGASIASTGGWTLPKILALACFAAGTPWPVLGFWNACLGLWLLHGVKDPLVSVAPFLSASAAPVPLTLKTAVLMTLRNEDPARALQRLEIVKDSLSARPEGSKFAYFVLSDTDQPEIAEAERAGVEAWRARDRSGAQIIYRRRAGNTGYKAGNIAEFCEAHGHDFDLMLPLDADSLMTGAAIVDLVRIMQAHPKLGLLQSLAVGTPSSSAFARIFQFGMRLGMRTYTMGQAWWTADCGPYWGHNAVVRIAPFAQHCVLPVLPGQPPFGGHILSHDQVEAALMRKAGFEVRVMPVEGGSYEDNPPDALEFIRRDQRWCQGNMQYAGLLGLSGLQPMSRFQLLWAMLMFIGVPAWTVLLALSPVVAWQFTSTGDFPAASAKALYVTFLLFYLAPKIAGFTDAVLTPGEVRRFGGPVKFVIGAVLELVFSFLLGAISAVRTSIFMIGLLVGKSVIWSGQSRDTQGIGWWQAARALWPQMALGLYVCGGLAIVSYPTLLWSLPLTAGYLLCVPFTVLTASPGFGRLLRQMGIAGIPEDFDPPLEIATLAPTSRTEP